MIFEELFRNGLLHENFGQPNVIGFSYVDYTGSRANQKPTIGLYVFAGGNLVS